MGSPKYSCNLCILKKSTIIAAFDKRNHLEE
jgi:hypothetical protein